MISHGSFPTEMEAIEINSKKSLNDDDLTQILSAENSPTTVAAELNAHPSDLTLDSLPKSTKPERKVVLNIRGSHVKLVVIALMIRALMYMMHEPRQAPVAVDSGPRPRWRPPSAWIWPAAFPRDAETMSTIFPFLFSMPAASNAAAPLRSWTWPAYLPPQDRPRSSSTPPPPAGSKDCERSTTRPLGRVGAWTRGLGRAAQAFGTALCRAGAFAPLFGDPNLMLQSMQVDADLGVAGSNVAMPPYRTLGSAFENMDLGF